MVPWVDLQETGPGHIKAGRSAFLNEKRNPKPDCMSLLENRMKVAL